LYSRNFIPLFGGWEIEVNDGDGIAVCGFFLEIIQIYLYLHSKYYVHKKRLFTVLFKRLVNIVQ